MNKTKKILIAVIFIASIGFLYWGINFLKGLKIFSDNTIVYVDYDETYGLTTNSPVLLNGLNIGKVDEFKFISDDYKVRVRLLIQTNIEIPKNSIALITSGDFLEGKVIKIILGDAKEYIKDNDFLKGEVSPDFTQILGAELSPLKEKAITLMASIDSTISIFQNIANPQVQNDLIMTIENIKKTTISLNKSLENIENIISNQIITNINQITDTIKNSDLHLVINNLNKDIYELQKIIDTINMKSGTIGKLIYDDSLYFYLTKSSQSLNYLLEDLRKNPKRYINLSLISFGSSSKERK
jgi:phospholipid/cholesterol/gamma-HCH transport system substrate-binding protein